MNEAVLTPEKVLDVTEDVLRRYGLAKATVVDVARALDVSHGSVYRHFSSKASLRNAVAKRWLDRVNAPLVAILEGSEPAPKKLDLWLRALFDSKHRRVSEDPEMFNTYLALAREACEVVKDHKGCLVGQIAQILRQGVEEGSLAIEAPDATAQAIFDATSRFHHPGFASEWSETECHVRVDAVITLIMRGIVARPGQAGG